jgi:hypothetical protein
MQGERNQEIEIERRHSSNDLVMLFRMGVRELENPISSLFTPDIPEGDLVRFRDDSLGSAE